ncbi:hypothetical protein [Egibacter rhizosphaerae]|uniref:hypothetical protein n=1 Tax=Egibacter rhizosphaerae TaxID=1670831 RepID=UPI0013F15F0B|nr:hypothetical protein [Egibacter rhizosphaerae]
MDLLTDITFDDLAGIALIVIGVYVALKVAKVLLKLAMVAVVLVGAYLVLT